MKRPRIVVSRCLGFDHCRYDGRIKGSATVESLRGRVEFIPVCPEVEIGLGVPRPPISIVRRGDELRLIQPRTGRDLTERMRSFGFNFLSHLGPVEGFILKSRSPSCGTGDACIARPAVPENRRRLERGRGSGGAGSGERGDGFFAAQVLERYPREVVESERRLDRDAVVRERFLLRLGLA